MLSVLRNTHENEEGHWVPFTAAAVAGAGVVTLAIGSATDSGLLAIIGGVVAAVGMISYDTVRHAILDKEFFRRTDKPGE